jgi:acetyl-CoA carboxylase carboxyltransferase component
MHTSVSGMGDQLCADDAEAIAAARELFTYLPSSWRDKPPSAPPQPPSHEDWDDVIPANHRAGYDVRGVIERVADAGSFFEVKARWAPELVIGLARVEGRAVGIVANQPTVRGGAIQVDSADKAARFISLCDAFNLPLLFLADIPGFMIGSAVERQGIIRHGAKMVAAMSSAEVPRFCVVLRKAFAAGYYAMSSPGFEPRATIALEGAQIGAMAAEAAIHAAHANKVEAIEDPAEREAFVAARVAEYEPELDAMRLASELLIEDVIPPSQLREELGRRLVDADGWQRRPPGRHHGAFPV